MKLDKGNDSLCSQPIQSLFDLAKTISAIQFKHHMRVEDAEVDIATVASISALPWTVQILIAGSDLEVMLRMHFSMDSAEKMLANRTGDLSATQNLALDLIRELSNLISGRIKALFESAGILMAQGLPFVLEGLTSASIFPLTEISAPTCIWSLTSKSVGQLVCSMTVVIENPSVTSIIANVSLEELPDTGEVELF
ncbi:MAG: hypothetical protein NTV34_10890 [Proteobacteria bacterium]|nr:hypothetical protein [Pseudomonadota bacterium]